jgi:hypothetical protein
VWCGVVWCGVIWFVVLWCGVLSYFISITFLHSYFPIIIHLLLASFLFHFLLFSLLLSYHHLSFLTSPLSHLLPPYQIQLVFDEAGNILGTSAEIAFPHDYARYHIELLYLLFLPFFLLSYLLRPSFLLSFFLLLYFVSSSSTSDDHHGPS